MIKLNLVANGIEQKKIKEYLANTPGPDGSTITGIK